MTVADLRQEETAIIVNCEVKRICDLGLSPGAEVRMVQPGSPCIICVFDKNICMGRDYQRSIRCLAIGEKE